ncbi:hypothetical protein [Flyfo microvirus Tbat2_88]|nr:hypothetical protein [Flyfo microvirus Tbat2_88]
MQKIGMIQAFVKLGEGEKDATFVHAEGQGDQARLIKMRILCPEPVNLFLVPVDVDYDDIEYRMGRRHPPVVKHYDAPEDTVFLAHVEAGMEQLEFYFRGSFCLRASGGDIYLDTYDNSSFDVESVDPVSYARLWERDERDPRILEIERAARHNQNMLREQMEADRAQFAAMMAEMKNNVTPAQSAPVPPAGSIPPSSASVPPAGDQQADPAAAPPAGGNA